MLQPLRLLLTCALTCFAYHFSQQRPLNYDVCPILNFQLPGRVSFPGSHEFTDQTKSYWATNQAELVASCRITPQSSDDVQKAMYLISSYNATFAVKSGGHSIVANSSNVANGVVIDLSLLNHVTVKPEASVVDVGAGARWSDIYEKLDERTGQHLAGARVGSVGIGGFVLGGGLSVFAATHGWACDQVAFFEVVLANGTLLEVNNTTHAELFRALKGGGSNFGVVTRMGLRLLNVPGRIDVWFVQYHWQQLKSVLKAVAQFTKEGVSKPALSVSMSIGSMFDGSSPAVSVMLTHSENVLESEEMVPFLKIPHTPRHGGRMSQLELAILYDEMNPRDYRQTRTTVTVMNDHELLIAIAQNFVSEFVPPPRSIEDGAARGGLLIQPLTLSHLHTSDSTGGNILGLSSEIEPLILLSVEIRHSSAGNDTKLNAEAYKCMYEVNAYATRRQLDHDFRYLNYASSEQHPFRHVSADPASHKVWQSVLDVKARYDPDNVFGRQIHDPFRIMEQ